MSWSSKRNFSQSCRLLYNTQDFQERLILATAIACGYDFATNLNLTYTDSLGQLWHVYELRFIGVEDIALGPPQYILVKSKQVKLPTEEEYNSIIRL